MMVATNPFRILGASTRDNSRRLLALAEELALVADPVVVSRARADLTNPRQRLRAELRWFPGVSPNRAGTLAQVAGAGIPGDALLQATPPLAGVNALVSGLAAAGQQNRLPAPPAVAAMVVRVAQMAEAIDASDILMRVNEDRSVAGLPTVEDIDLLESELQEWRGEVRGAIADLIRGLGDDSLRAVLHEVVSIGTASGTAHGPSLLHDLTDALAVDLQQSLDAGVAEIRAEMDVLLRMAGAGLPEEELLQQASWLDAALRSWDTVAQPLQLSAQARGQEHDHSQAVAAGVRALALQLHNDHGMTAVSERVTVMMREVFAELMRTAERAAEDLQAIESALTDRASRQKWEQSLRYEGAWGIVFRERVSITAEGVQHNDVRIPLPDITRVRWGGTRHSVNFIPTGTTYSVRIASQDGVLSFQPSGDVYEGLIPALWRAVVLPMMIRLTERLKAGETVQFGSALIDDEGIALVKTRVFRNNLSTRFSWSQVRIGSHDGSFTISADTDRGYNVSLSYLHEDNVHVLEGVMRLLWKNGGNRLSDVFARGAA